MRKQYIKVRFLKHGEPTGRPYTYRTDAELALGDIVWIDKNTKGIVTELDVPDFEVESFKDKVKSILGKVQPCMMKNWFVQSPLTKPFRAPETLPTILCGNVYGSPKFEDGAPISTSRIVGIEDCGDHKKIKTQSESIYLVYPADVLPDAASEFPDYYERLKMEG